ncbi:LysR family transcriptional regulator [Oleiagrimonas soli]|uniref:DNA-binding transcriptional LysR family regulator n=1 Tax=Oleiagrimonas soli TaxID=1543381 RepID=A0A099CXN3_9GAMM|nr:LysR substrate-binding domain-containing protein [Oleiagrimonas soli]KGI78416.1 LysR family transcriptional regulator [Oleiagrimonas soli]MBB6183450.1 DNA-binding transcriptional LysR family regulator [Oleiagrimonas soli]
MELRQLQHFVAVAEEGHFTRASRRVHIVQSALSASIRRLEDELDAQLFVRNTRQVRLTEVGRVFLDKAREVLEAATSAREAVAAVQGLQRGKLSIGSVQSLPSFVDLPALLGRFYQQHAGVDVRLCQGSASHLLEKIRSGRLDLAFLTLCEAPAGIQKRMIACDALVLVCAPAHPLATRKRCALDELCEEPFVDFQADWGTRRLIDRGFLEAGIDRHTAFEVNDLGTLLELVRHGLGIALLPESIARAQRPALAVVPLSEPELCWELVVAYAAETGALPVDQAPRAFLDLLADAHPLPLAAAENAA